MQRDHQSQGSFSGFHIAPPGKNDDPIVSSDMSGTPFLIRILGSARPGPGTLRCVRGSLLEVPVEVAVRRQDRH